MAESESKPETKTGFPTPSPWLTIILSSALAFGAARYDLGRKDENYERRISDLEKFQTATEARWQKEREAREAQYQAAEALRNQQKDAAVAQMEATTQELRNTLSNLKPASNGNK